MSRAVVLRKGANYTNAASTSEVIPINHGTRRRYVLLTMSSSNLASASLGGVPLNLAWDGATLSQLAGVSSRLAVFDLPENQFPSDGLQTLLITPSSGTPHLFYQWYLLDQCDQKQQLKASRVTADITTSVAQVSVPSAIAGDDDLSIHAVGNFTSIVPDPAAPFLVDSQLTSGATTFKMTTASRLGRHTEETFTWSGLFTSNYYHINVLVAGHNTDVLKRNERHVQIGRAKLMGMFWGKPRFNTLLRIFLRQVQAAEATLWDIMEAYDPRSAVGFRLDVVGSLVGQPRFQFDDETYRRVIYGRIRAARSDGKEDDIIEVIQLVCALSEGITLEDVGNATFVAEIARELTLSEITALLYLLPKTRPAGAQMHLVSPVGTGLAYGSSGFIFSGGAEAGNLPYDVRKI